MRTLTASEVSDHMRRIRSSNTRPELLVRRVVTSMGFRYRLHNPKLPGRPDLSIGHLQKAIFVHGCFWHQHAKCDLQSVPKRNRNYWLPKFRRTKARDKKNKADLTRMGWRYLVLWECELKSKEEFADRL